MVRIGTLAGTLGVSTDTIRFYERSGILPRPDRADNGYRDYGADDATHLRLLVDLRRLDVPLDLAASLARSCHAGHCDATSAELPELIALQRRELAARVEGLRRLDDRLAELERHLAAAATRRRTLPMLAETGPCCDAASAIIDVVEGTCTCCAVTTRGPGDSLDQASTAC